MKQRVLWIASASAVVGVTLLAATSTRGTTTIDAGSGSDKHPTTTTTTGGPPTTTVRTEPIALVDETGTSTLLIQTQANQPDTGKFTFTVTGKTSYQATATVTPRNRGVRVVGTDSTAVALDAATSQRTVTTVRIAGRVRPEALYGRLTIWVGGEPRGFRTAAGMNGYATSV